MDIKSVNVKSADIESISKPRKRKRLPLKIVLLSLGFIIVCAGVVAIVFYSKLTDGNYDSLYSNPDAAAAVMQSPSIISQDSIALPTTSAVVTPSLDLEYNGKKYIKNDSIVNLLFLGIDTNAERRINMEGYRSDMVMVCAIDTKAKKVTLISIPRDTYTTVYKLNEDTGEVTETVQYKINTAYSYGGGAKKYSFRNAMDCVEMFLERRCELKQPLGFSLDIPVYLYASINMDGIQQVASSVGGVEVTLDMTISGVGKKGQTVLLRYANAETYLRDRHSSGEGDLSRGKHQQTFLISLAKKIKSMGAPSIILNSYDDLQRYVTTNLSLDQMLDLAEILSDVNIDSIQMLTVPGEGSKPGSTWFYFHDEAATLQMLLDVYYIEVQ